ncbi:MAG: hypothetical protein ACYC00_20830, partial [Eubacteriales bacterium]
PPPSFRFALASDTLGLGYTLPTTRACSGLSPVRLHPCWAHNRTAMNAVRSQPSYILCNISIKDVLRICR